MTLWTFCQSMLLTFNAFAILNEQRFLDKYGLGQGAVNSGYVPSGSARGQAGPPAACGDPLGRCPGSAGSVQNG